MKADAPVRNSIALTGRWTQALRSKRLRQNVFLWAMLAPVIAFYITVKYIPMGGLVIAFKQYNFTDGILHSPWVGMKNFEYLWNHPDTLQIIRNTFMLSILSVGVGFPVPIALAIMMNEVRRMWYKKLVQTLVYLPHFLSWVIVGSIVLTVFSQETGLVNSVLKLVTGGESYAFLYNEGSWISIFVGAGIWKDMGFNAIIYLAALSTIDPSLFEAVSIDGGGKWKQIWHITLPGIRGTIVLTLILALGKVMEVGFDPVFMLQNRVVTDVSEVISTYIYKNGVLNAEFSTTTAIGLFESLVAFVLVISANKIARKFDQGLW
ncbi:sugar ABC transporter permease [Paenibacillus sp. YN15]|uniref:ABC transporter permease n=1 Tax=Paenibacillus sp. YN15 TaxID=1742774 RepID=UPI000DCEC36B|nr:ABC transporter permease subunit [Paenibacillus sp. YN15]RAV01966.1 sugar ABC transporter permease [Paenibacillus sp. YN15]